MARGMGARRSLVATLSVPLIAVVMAVALFLPIINHSYASPQTYTYHLTIQRGANTTLTITNNTIQLTIAYNENYGSVSGTLMNNFFIASGRRVYISYVPTFCEVKPAPIPFNDEVTPSVLAKPVVHLLTLGASHLIILPPPPPPPPLPPPPPPAQKSVGSINLTISFIPVEPISAPVNITVPLLPCTPFSSSVNLLPGYYKVTVQFAWLLSSEFYGLNGVLNISVVHINVITPLPKSP